MPHRARWLAASVLPLVTLASLHAAVSRQGADTFAEKVAQIRSHGEAGDRVGGRRTAVTQDELNSWFAYRAQPLLPEGVTQPAVTIVGQGRLTGQAVVDLDAIGRRRAAGGPFNPWNLLAGRVPLNVTGILHTRDGMGRFELQSADISGVPVPAVLLQELVSVYSRTPDRPQGVRMDDTFALPANIRQIEIGQGQAVVVQ